MRREGMGREGKERLGWNRWDVMGGIGMEGGVRWEGLDGMQWGGMGRNGVDMG